MGYGIVITVLQAKISSISLNVIDSRFDFEEKIVFLKLCFCEHQRENAEYKKKLKYIFSTVMSLQNLILNSSVHSNWT